MQGMTVSPHNSKGISTAPDPASPVTISGKARFFGELESLRGLAALSIALHHVSWKNPMLPSLYIHNSYLFVDLFFVLSGFVICHSYERKITGPKSLGRFMFLRWGRLYPLHFLMLLVFVVLGAVQLFLERRYGFVPAEGRALSNNDLPAFITHIFLVQAFKFTPHLTFNQPSWSIGVEFYTYLCFGLIVSRCRGISIVMGWLAAGSLALLVASGCPGLIMLQGVSFFRCLAGFSVGVLAYRAFCRFESDLARCNQWLVIVFVLSMIWFFCVKTAPSSDYVVLIAFPMLIALLAASPMGAMTRLLNIPMMRWLGRISYSVYMTHFALVIVLAQVLEVVIHHWHIWDGGFGRFSSESLVGLAFVFLYVAVLLLVSHFTYVKIEMPWQQRTRALAQSWSGTPAPLRPISPHE